jgi:hypothetical protein
LGGFAAALDWIELREKRSAEWSKSFGPKQHAQESNMTDSTTPPAIGDGTPSSPDAGNADINGLIDQMNAAFETATEVNIAITNNKTIDGAKETAAQQRPNIG